MKRASFVAIAACILASSLSCQKNNSSSKEKALTLQAPSGQQVASIQQLKAEAARVALYKHNAEQGIKITRVDYLPVTKGYAAIVSYSLEDGTTGNFGIFSGVKISFDASTITAVPRNESTAAQKEGKVTISCKGTCNCTLNAVLNADTGIITVDCGCSGCTSQVVQS